MFRKNRQYTITVSLAIPLIILVMLFIWLKSTVVRASEAFVMNSTAYVGIRLPFPANDQYKVTRILHDGTPAIDFETNGMSVPVSAMHGGKVSFTGWDSAGGGNMLIIDHEDGYCSVYLHLASFSVLPNAIVSQGEIIAMSGNTGWRLDPPGSYILHVAVHRPSNGVCNSSAASPSFRVPTQFDEGVLMPSQDSPKSQNVSGVENTITLPKAFRNLIHNGSFTALEQHWSAGVGIDHEVRIDQILYFQGKLGSSQETASIIQDIHYRIPPNSPFEVTVELGNTSDVPKLVTIGLHQQGQTIGISCDYLLEPQSDFSTYKIQGVVNSTTEVWDALSFEVWARDMDGIEDIKMDDVVVEYLDPALVDVPALQSNTQCSVSGMVHANNNASVAEGSLGRIVDSEVNNGMATYYIDWANPTLTGSWEIASALTRSSALFPDVPETNSFYYYIQLLRFANVVNGFNVIPREYRPDNPITREEMSKIIAEILEDASNGFQIDDCNEGLFPDVDEGNPFCKYITALVEEGIVEGDCDVNGENCVFNPKDNLSRGAMAKFVAKSLLWLGKLPSIPACSQQIFSDVPNEHTFCPYINALANANIINGHSCASSLPCFSPDDPVTRGEAAKFVANSSSLLDATVDTGNYPVFDQDIVDSVGAESVTGTDTNDLNIDPRAELNLNLVTSSPLTTTYWIASEDGLRYYVQNGSDPIAFPNSGLENKVITALSINPLNNELWAGTYTGAYQYDGVNWVIHTTPDLPSAQINDIAVSDSGEVWISVAGNLVSYNNSQWTTYPLGSTLVAIAIDDNNLVWGITDSKDVGYFDGSVWTPIFDTPANPTAIDILANIIMLGTSNGLVQYSNNVFTPIAPNDFGIKVITHDNQGQFWIVTEYGNVGVYDPVTGEWTVSLPDSPLSYLIPNPIDVFHHLGQQRRLHEVVDSPDYAPGTFVAPDSDWQGSTQIAEGEYTDYQSYALHRQNVAVFRTSEQNSNGEDIAWENGDVASVFGDVLQNNLAFTVLNETQMTTAMLAEVDILILPSFSNGFHDEVVAALGTDGLAALATFVNNGGFVYAQGQGQYLLEAASLVAPGTIDVTTPITTNLGMLDVHDPTHPLTFNWETNSLWILDDPTLTINAPLTTIASYSNTVGGPQPAIVYGQIGQGQVVLVNGHPTSPLYRDQLNLFINGLLLGMAERGELHGRAIQTYASNVPDNIIPAYEEGIPISVTLNFEHLWQGITLTNVIVTERVQEGFTVYPGSIAPLPSSIEITHTNGTTETIITWILGDVSSGPVMFHYTATTGVNTMAPGSRLFSYGEATFGDGPRQVVWERPDFWLYPRMAARLEGEHDKEPDRFYTIPAEGVYLDEFVFLENKEDTTAHAIGAVRYIPLIVPIVGLEEQREPLATNAGETVWMKNAFFVYDDPRYLWPEGMTAITETWDLDDWDGTTFITMTTPGGYHIDPIPFPLAENLGFFVTIPPSYTHMITVTANHELLLPALRVEWDLGDFPGYWYELPAIRYGIHSTELFSRAVSFTGDPIVGSVVVDATGGSVYTGLGEDPLLYRDYLAPVEVHPPTAPITSNITYQDIWSRTHELPIRAGFYDVFNFASCGCGTGVGERHAALNVTFAIWVDTDGDGVKETMLTDFEEMKGLMPTRLEGDLDIIIKSRNLGTLIHSNENIIEGNIFRGLGFDIEPRYGSWADSYQSTYSALISNTEQAAYHELIFQQSVPVNATDLITIHARFDPNNSLIEGMMKLHDGVRFVYRQNVAGEGQYEVIDTHVQGAIGVRSDAVIINYLTPAFASTYTDTFFIDYDINDWYESRAFVSDPYQVSWGYGNLAATTYVGGREQRDLFHSIINLGDRTFLRVEVNNNSGVTLQNVSLAPVVLPGITVTQLYTDNVPVPLWPDLPFINVPNIPDASYGLYFFELQTSPVYTALLNTVQEIPIQFSAINAPAEFEIPPALLAIRGANGETPHYVSGYSHNLRGRDVYEPYITVQDIRLLNDDQMFTLRQLVLSDISTIPHTNLAWAYYNTLTNTIPYTFNNGVLSYTVPITNLPWVDNGLETGVHVVAYNAISVTHSTRYPVNSGGVLTSTDDFDMDWVSTANPLFLEVRGANVNTLYNVTQITRTLTGQAAPFLYASEWNEVIIAAATTNEGNDVAANTFVTITVDSAFNLVNAPSNITIIPGGLLWDVGDLAPGASRQVELEFAVFAPLPTPFGPIVLGDMDAFTRSDGEFVNVFSGQLIQAQVGNKLNIVIGSDTTLLAETGLQAQVDTSPLYAGETATLYAQIVNNGPSAAANVILTPTLPISLTNPVFSSSQGSCDPITYVCQLLDLPVGAAAYITITSVTDLDAEGDQFVHFSHHTDALDINPNNNEATVMLTLLPAPADTALTAQATVNPVVAGDPVEIVIQTTTAGPGTAYQAILTPTLPVTLIDPVIVTTQGSCDSSTLICHLGELPVGTTVVLTVTANTNLNVAGTWPAHFVVGTSNLDTNLSNNEASLDLVLSPTPADAALAAQATVNPVNAGEPVEVIIAAANNGPGTVQQGIFTPTLPISLTNPVIVTTQGSCNSATLVCNLGDIAIGQTVVLTVTGNTSPGIAGIWPAHFAIGASNPDTNLSNNEVMVEIEVVSVPTDVSLIALTGKSSPYWLVMAGSLGILLIGVIGFWKWRKPKLRST